MQYITNITFWLTSAMQSVVVAIGVGLFLLIISLFGFGFGIGRIWNTKWSLNAPCLLVSLPIALITATLGAMYVGMNFINKTVLAKDALPSVIQQIENSLSSSPKLMEQAFKAGIKKMVSSNAEIDQNVINEECVEFSIPGASDDERSANEQAFIAGAIDAIVKGKKTGKGSSARKSVEGLSDMAPFSYGYAPSPRDDDKGTIQAAYTEAMSTAGKLGEPISLQDSNWYANLVSPIVNHNLTRFSKTVGKDLDSQTSSLIGLIVALLLIQGGLISWLAFIDIKPLADEKN